MTKTSPIARTFAVIALAAAVVLVFVVLSSATGGDDGDKGSKNPDRMEKSGESGNKNKPKTKAKTYEVQEGDTLTGIASKTGISVEVIEKLNPDLDPQALTLGQKLKLR